MDVLKTKTKENPVEKTIQTTESSDKDEIIKETDVEITQNVTDEKVKNTLEKSKNSNL